MEFLKEYNEIQNKRREHWNRYYEALKPLADKAFFKLPELPEAATNNAHMFYLVFPSLDKRTALIQTLKSQDILAVFHYLSLHSSPYYADKHDGRVLDHSDRYSDCLLRLPMFYELSESDLTKIIATIYSHFEV